MNISLSIIYLSFISLIPDKKKSICFIKKRNGIINYFKEFFLRFPIIVQQILVDSSHQ